MSATRWPRRRWGRALLLLGGGTLLWTLLVCYPNPTLFFRNLARYRRLPLDPQVERKMGWGLPSKPADIEDFLDQVLTPTSDWKQYGVPWYVPTPMEVATSFQGDCEAKTILFASLLSGRGEPYTIRASFNHIWVDYPGRPETPGERARLAYLEGRGNRLGMRWPPSTDWASFFAVEKQMLWDEMPPLRRITWGAGLIWLLLAAFAVLSPRLRGEYESHWRPSLRLYFESWLWALLGQLLGFMLLLRVSGWSLPHPWLSTSLELTAAAAAVAWLGTWILVRFLPRFPAALDLTEADLIGTTSRLGLRARTRLPISDVAELELLAPRFLEGPWEVCARLGAPQRAPLLRYREEVEARRTLAELGRRLSLPVVVRAEKTETRTPVEEIGRPLCERLEAAGAAPPQRPKHLDLVVDEEEARWTLRYPPTRRALRWVLLGLALLPAGLFGTASWTLHAWAHGRLAWMTWAVVAALFCTFIYLLVLIQDELVARLANAKVELAEGEVRCYGVNGKVERVPLQAVESVELGRVRGVPTVAVVTATKVLHLRHLFAPEERAWGQGTLISAIISAQERQATALPKS